MSILQQELVDKITNLSEDNVKFILEMINRYMESDAIGEADSQFSRIGIASGVFEVPDDIDADNAQIEKMFGELL